MKHIIYKSIVVASAISLLVSCKPNLPIPAPSKGKIDASHYVALGNSITSGYADGALYYDGQMASFPNLIAGQLKLIGGGSFNQPLMNPSSVGVGATGNAPFKLGYSTDCLHVTSLMPIPTATVGDVSALSTNVYAGQGPFNNMGVPGAKVINVDSIGYGLRNPFYTRMASNPATATILADATAINATFFSVFIGNNDVLGYATNGGASDAITPSAGGVGVGFDASLLNVVNKLTANGAKGVIGNIPDITSLPYFTTIPWNGLTLRQGQADTLNGIWASNNVPLYNFKAGNNPFIIADPTATPLPQRLIKEGEFILLSVPLNSIKCMNMGTLIPIPNKYVLTFNEIINIQTATIAYNQTIKSVAQLKGLAFVDVQAFMNKTKTGFTYDGINFNAAFVTGGTFSLDGIHLNPVGNALLANEFIKSINATYQSTIPQVDATKYRGVVFP